MQTTTDPRPRCLKCRHVLRSAKSIARGYGPTCAKYIKENATVAATDFKAVQVEKAVQLIADGGIVRSIRPRLFFAVSSKGDENYVVNTIDNSCTCKAGLNSRRCYHLAAVQILDAA